MSNLHQHLDQQKNKKTNSPTIELDNTACKAKKRIYFKILNEKCNFSNAVMVMAISTIEYYDFSYIIYNKFGSDYYYYFFLWLFIGLNYVV